MTTATETHRQYVPVTEAQIPEGVRWDVRPRDAGQMVEISYSILRGQRTAGEEYRRTEDRSTRSVTYEALVVLPCGDCVAERGGYIRRCDAHRDATCYPMSAEDKSYLRKIRVGGMRYSLSRGCME